MIRSRPIRHDIVPLLTKVGEYLSSQPDIAAAYLFGSYARGEAGPLSDVDIAILLDEGGSKSDRFDRRLMLMAEVGRLLQTDELDLITINDAPVPLAFRVFQEGKLLTCRDEITRARLQARVMSMYYDTESFRTRLTERYLGLGGGDQPVDHEVIASRLSRLQRCINRLKGLAQHSLADYEASLDLQDMAERNLQVAIQCCIDVGTHLIADLGLEIPVSYGQVFGVMADHELIPRSSVTTLRRMVGFRNVLVHDYLDLDTEHVYRAVQAYGDFEQFIRDIKTAIHNLS